MYKNFCLKCKLRDSCTQLCKEAEDYINQDYVGRREGYFLEGDVSEVFENIPPQDWPELKENTHLTPREREILTLLGRGLNRADVCQVLKITRHTLREHIKNFRKKLLNS